MCVLGTEFNGRHDYLGSDICVPPEHIFSLKISGEQLVSNISLKMLF